MCLCSWYFWEYVYRLDVVYYIEDVSRVFGGDGEKNEVVQNVVVVRYSELELEGVFFYSVSYSEGVIVLDVVICMC